jgi:hypothetical protein
VSDWIDMNGIGTAAVRKQALEYAVQFHNGVIVERSPNEGMAQLALGDLRGQLNSMGVPELYWPILVVREVSLVAGGWYGRDE